MKALLLLFFVLISEILFAQNNNDTIILLSDFNKSISIGKQIYVYEDKSCELTFADVKKTEYLEKFELSEIGSPNFGYSNSAYWIRFHLKNTSQKPLEILLECGYPVINDIELYISESEIRKAGTKFPFDEREIHYRNNIFRLPLHPDSVHTFYMCFKTQSSMQFPLKIYSSQSFLDKINVEQLLWGFYFGIVLIMVIYNLFLFFSLKNINYLYFVFYLVTFGFSQFSVHGFSFEFLWNNSGTWTLLNIPFFFNLSAAFAIKFAQSFLNTKKDSRKLHIILEIFKWLNIANAALAFIIQYKFTSKIAALLVILSSVVLIAAGTIRIIQGFKSARYFLLAWIVFLIGSFVYSVKVNGWFPTTFFTEYAINFGNVLEITFLSFALAHSYKLIKLENEKSQNELLLLQRKTNEELELQIEERTREIVQKNYELISAEEELKQQNEELSTISENLYITNETLKEEKKKAEEINQKITIAYDDLFKNEKKLAAIFDTANEGIALVDKNANFTFVNSCVCAIFGYPMEEMLKLNYFELLADTNDTNRENFRKLVSGEAEVITTENQYFRKDKTKIWGKLSVRCLRNAKGEFLELVGILTDIDKLKKSEEKVKQSFKELSISNKKLQSLFESPTVGIVMTDNKFNVTYFNSYLTKLTGYSEEEILKMNFTDFLLPENRKSVIVKFRNLLKGDENNINFEINFVRKDKSRFWANFSSAFIRDDAGNTQMTVGILTDIDNLKKSEEKVKQAFKELSISNQKLQIILDSPTVGIGVCNPKSDFIFCNNRLAEMLACTNDELLTMNFIDFVYPDERKKVILAFRNLIRRTDERISLDFNFIRKDKLRIWANFTGAAIKDETGNIQLIVGVLTDIEKIKKSEEKVKQSYQNIKQLSEIGKEITSNLNVENIVEIVYKHIRLLMDVNIFAIGLHNSDENILDFYGKSNENNPLERSSDSLDYENHISVACFKNQKQIFISDFLNSSDNLNYYNFYTDKQPLSIIYLPLMVKEKAIGVITIQSFEKNAYNSYHIDILKNIAIYTSIALENASSFQTIEKQKEEIEKSHYKITSSINYAQRIQMAVLPDKELVSILLPNNFILFKPRDIVSGDFYFIKQIKNHTILAVGDCTGHGVPGAFMSMLGMAVLNEIVRNAAIIRADETLNELRKQIKVALQQTGGFGEQQDGMDIALCVINIETMKMRYAGANIPCWIFRNDKSGVNNDELRVINDEFSIMNKAHSTLNTQNLSLNTHLSTLITLEADKQPIGVFAKEKPFTEHKIELCDGDIFYLFSDGYISQFGGNKNEKFRTNKFKELLSDIKNFPMNEQKQILEEKFEEWKGNNEQTDDVLVVSVKI